MEFKLLVQEKYDSKRAVDVLVDEFGISSQMQKRIRLYGNLWINGEAKRMIDIVHTGDIVMAHPSKDSSELTPIKSNPIDNVEIIFEDDHLIVVNKPPGMVVHPTMGHQTNTLLDLLSDKKLHLVTRLDRETSGALIIAKHAHAHYRIVQTPIKRIYQALCHGHWFPDAGTINEPIQRHPNSIMIRTVDKLGKVAITHYQVIKSYLEKNFDLVEFTLETGRTHQIRVHSLYNAHPLLGDGLYGISNYCAIDENSNLELLPKDRSLRIVEPETDKQVIVEPVTASNIAIDNANLAEDSNYSKPLEYRVNPQLTDKFTKLLNKNQLILDQQIHRQALHSRIIGFTHPISKKYIEFKAELPQDMKNLI